jgi:predicted ATPase
MASEPSRLVGRERELATLSGLLSSLPRGGQRSLEVSGEPGIGKTCLLGAVLADARARGYTALRGCGADFERAVPFSLIIDAVDDYLADLNERTLRQLCGPEHEKLTTVFPAIGVDAEPSAGAPSGGAPPPPPGGSPPPRAPRTPPAAGARA